MWAVNKGVSCESNPPQPEKLSAYIQAVSFVHPGWGGVSTKGPIDGYHLTARTIQDD